MCPNNSIYSAKIYAPRSAVGNEQPVERVACPVEPHGVVHECRDADVVDREPSIAHYRIAEIRVTHGQATGLGEKLDLEERDRRYAPGSIAIQPWIFPEPRRSQDEPDQEMRVQQYGHPSDLRLGIRSAPGPAHSHDHRSASSAFGTLRSSRYFCGLGCVPVASSSSRRSTTRCPFRCITITSPRAASSKRENHCLLASDAVTVFMCTMYKDKGWSQTKIQADTDPLVECSMGRVLFGLEPTMYAWQSTCPPLVLLPGLRLSLQRVSRDLGMVAP